MRPVRHVVIRAAAILVAGVVAGALIAGDWKSPVRVVLTLAFLLFGPGLALTEFLAVRDVAQQLAIAPAFSLAVDTIVGLALLYAGAYSAGLTFAIVLGLSALLLAAALVRAIRAARRTAAGGVT